MTLVQLAQHVTTFWFEWLMFSAMVFFAIMMALVVVGGSRKPSIPVPEPKLHPMCRCAPMYHYSKYKLIEPVQPKRRRRRRRSRK